MHVADRFMRKIEMVPEAGCWLWIASTYPDGRYGKFCMGRGEYDGAHRASWRIFKGAIPPGAFVLHRCDVSLCCNPAHLFIGSAQENMDDKTSKGRHKCPKGEEQWKAKLTEDSVREIRRMHAEGVTQRAIAKLFGVTFNAVWDVVHRKNWKSVL